MISRVTEPKNTEPPSQSGSWLSMGFRQPANAKKPFTVPAPGPFIRTSWVKASGSWILQINMVIYVLVDVINGSF